MCALDLDGTLLDSRHRVSAATRHAVARVAGQGCRVVLASSRAPIAIPYVLEQLHDVAPIDVIAAQGAVVGTSNSGRTLDLISQSAIPVDAAVQVVELASRAAPTAAVSWFTTTDWFVNRRSAATERESRITHAAPTTRDLLTLTLAPVKIMVITDGLAASLAVKNAICSHSMNATLSHDGYVEITAAGVDKAEALRQVCATRGVRVDEVLAIGDGENDVPLLRIAGLSAAPANAVPHAAKAAAFHIRSNDENGPARLLNMVADTQERCRT